MQKISFLIFIVFICFFTACGNKQNADSKKTRIELKAVELADNGWGYQIDVNGKKLIYQDIIPIISGNKTFKTKEDALKVGRLTVERMKEEGFPPNISLDEIKALGIDLTE